MARPAPGLRRIVAEPPDRRLGSLERESARLSALVAALTSRIEKLEAQQHAPAAEERA
ncbi:MAG: hypothetical protein ACRELB_21935 [Polyangiaceae bacterium]